MSFYTVIDTELKSKKHIILALEELKRRGEITKYGLVVKQDKIRIDRSGDIIHIGLDVKTGNFHVEGDVRVVEAFAKRLKQFYAYESIKESLPLDFEIASEREIAGDITLVLKG
ncbi:MAG: hypothetical protein HY883_04125 [Deltaproteobacteria bacterium]|nr:hypothetical protein [Deltaproteobacteria bacterium]